MSGGSPETPGPSIRGRALLAGLTALALTAVFLPPSAEALPQFARQVGRDCGYCHNAVPRLNDAGRTFLFNGYRFEAEGEWRTVKDIVTPPVAFEVEVEGIYNNVRSAGGRVEESDFKVEEAEILAGGAFGKDGRVSALLAVAVQQNADDTFDTVIPKAFIQINDLAGPQGAGTLNLKAGVGEVGMPMLRPASTPITNAMFAESILGVIGSGERFVELNGALLTEGDRTLNHRYRAGLSRESVLGDDKLKGLYGTWATTIDETYTFGVIVRKGEETAGVQDVPYLKYGAGGELVAGPIVLTAAYFRSDRDGAPDADDWLAEALWFVKRYTLGARYETAGVDGARRASSQTLMARYDIMTSTFLQFEYRHRRDPDRTAGGGELENKARILLLTLF